MPILRCSNEDGRGDRCELAAEHVGYPHRSKTWEWDFGPYPNSGPRRPETPGVWWPVYEEVLVLKLHQDAQEE